jgi:Putative Ig domain
MVKPTVVQSQTADFGSTCAFAGPVTAGNLIIVSFSYELGTFVGVTDTVGTVYAEAVSQLSGSVKVRTWYGIAGGSGANTVSLNMAGPSFLLLFVAEISGCLAVVDAVDKGLFGMVVPATVPAGSLMTSTGQELIFSHLGGYHSFGVFQPQAPFKPLSFRNGHDCAGTAIAISGSSGGTWAPNWDQVNNGDNASWNLVAFKAALVLTVTTDSLPDAILGNRYYTQLEAESGHGAYTWSVVSGALPTGLILDPTGVLYGVPTGGVSTVSITFRVADALSASATAALNIKLGSAAATIALIQSRSLNLAAIPFLSNVTKDSLIVVGANYNRFGWALMPPPTDSLGTIYKLVGWNSFNENGDLGSQMWVGIAPSSGPNTVTRVNPGGVATVAEFSGGQVSTDSSLLTEGDAGASTSIISNSIGPLADNALIFANAGGVDSSIVLHAIWPSMEINSTANLATAYRIATAAGGYNVTFTFSDPPPSGGNHRWYILLGSFRPAIGVGGISFSSTHGSCGGDGIGSSLAI